MAQLYQLTDKIALCQAPIQNGILTIGLTVRVTVYNNSDGSILLNNVTLNSAGNGFYYYIWTHGRTVKTWCTAVYTVSGLLTATAVSEKFTVDDGLNADLSESGRAF